MSKHRASPRTARRGRAGALALAVAVTVGIGGAAVGVLPQVTADRATARQSGAAADAARPASIESARLAQVKAQAPTASPSRAVADELQAKVASAAAKPEPAPPQGSGEGRRIVFDQGDQRVWLIGDDGEVERTYRVSGSRFENLKPGAYAVQSRTRHATAFDASGTMEYFVRFATGFSEPIGFHSVPVDNSGRLEQTKAQLGQRLSAGCVRQWKPDAIALWDFAPVGTKVFVTA